VNKSAAGHLAKAGVEAGEIQKEFRLASADLASLTPGSAISVEIFQAGQLVDVTGTTQGKGFLV
jgi:LSU ribosomal protein L3P